MIVTGDVKTGTWTDHVEMSSSKKTFLEFFNSSPPEIQEFNVLGTKTLAFNNCLTITFLYNDTPPILPYGWRTRLVEAISFDLVLYGVSFYKIKMLCSNEYRNDSLLSIEAIAGKARHKDVKYRMLGVISSDFKECRFNSISPSTRRRAVHKNI